jgi:hypothetical protein
VLPPTGNTDSAQREEAGVRNGVRPFLRGCDGNDVGFSVHDEGRGDGCSDCGSEIEARTEAGPYPFLGSSRMVGPLVGPLTGIALQVGEGGWITHPGRHECLSPLPRELHRIAFGKPRLAHRLEVIQRSLETGVGLRDAIVVVARRHRADHHEAMDAAGVASDVQRSKEAKLGPTEQAEPLEAEVSANRVQVLDFHGHANISVQWNGVGPATVAVVEEHDGVAFGEREQVVLHKHRTGDDQVIVPVAVCLVIEPHTVGRSNKA